MEAANATGLVYCPTLAEEITTCQSIGRKVFLSLGGSDGNITFANATQAQESAEMVWDIFGAGTAYNSSLRPFGDSVVDGFDIGEFSSPALFAFLLELFVRSLLTLIRPQIMNQGLQTTGSTSSPISEPSSTTTPPAISTSRPHLNATTLPCPPP